MNVVRVAVRNRERNADRKPGTTSAPVEAEVTSMGVFSPLAPRFQPQTPGPVPMISMGAVMTPVPRPPATFVPMVMMPVVVLPVSSAVSIGIAGRQQAQPDNE